MLQNAKLSIRTKIALGYLLIICCLGISIFVVTSRISSLQEEIKTITSRDLEIHNLITTIRYNVINMETSQRGYVITGNEEYLEPYTDGKTSWLANYNSLYTYLADEPSSRKELEEIKLNIENWIETAGEPAIALRKANDTVGIMKLFQDDTGRRNIDQLRTQIENLRQKEIQSTQNHILQLENRNNILIISLYVLLTIVSIVAFAIVFFVSGSIVKTINQVVKTISYIASSSGDLTTRIKVKTRDEVKDLADATNALLISVNSQNWIQTKVAEVATMNQGINDMDTLADSFLAKLAPILNASYGVFYLRRGSGSDQKLVKIASYAAYGEQADTAISFRMGEGLIGQAAVEKRTFLINSTDTHPIHIKSGMGSVVPQSILVLPIEFEGEAIAIVEFASTQSITSDQLKLLEQIEKHFGVAINNVVGRMEVARLLSESQVMTEELQAQTEELQAQSEELQMQQEEMRMTTEHLEEQNLCAEQKTRELEKAKEELEDYSEKLKKSSQYKSNFLANMSHELRTPLNSILILSQILLENENNTLTSEEAGFAKVIHTSGQDLIKLIDDILDLSKIEAGKVILTMDEVNVTEIPEHMQLMFAPVAEQKGIDFTISTDAGVPSVIYTDGQRLQQILKNLLSNAFKFTEKGSVTLKIQNADSELIKKYIDQYEQEPVLAIAVTDTGIGIPQNKQQMIFEAFQQVDGETNRQYGGTGLGLSIVREFTRLLGGQILLESEIEKGSTFTLLVPSRPNMEKEQLVLSYEEEAAAAIETAAVIPEEKEAEEYFETAEYDHSLFMGKKVLLVEDDSRNVFALVKALESKGLEVTVASNGRQCLEIIQQQTDFDLVLMDIMMPFMDGYDTMKVIRQNAAMMNTPMIALTAKAMKSDRDKCLEAGASDYISKPLNMEQLFSIMRVWLTKQVGE